MSKYPEYVHTKSREWFERALNVIPSGIYGHLGPTEGLFLPLEKWPLISSKAKGTYFWDMDGNKYLDLMCAYGPNVLGYGDPDVDRAAMEQLLSGNCTTAPSYKMVEPQVQAGDLLNCYPPYRSYGFWPVEVWGYPGNARPAGMATPPSSRDFPSGPSFFAPTSRFPHRGRLRSRMTVRPICRKPT